jgi:hypothetical protein
MLRRRSDQVDCFAKHRWSGSNRPDPEDYTTTLMIAAVVSAAGNVATVLIELGRSAGWWH